MIVLLLFILGIQLQFYSTEINIIIISRDVNFKKKTAYNLKKLDILAVLICKDC